MPSLKSLKRRITSVTNTRHIMKAMDLVAASKLQKAREQRDAIHDLFAQTRRVVATAARYAEESGSAFITPREKIRNAVYVVITSDRGLCGGYNVNISRAAFEAVKTAGGGVSRTVVAVGRKAEEYFRRRNVELSDETLSAGESAYGGAARQIADMVSAMYASEEADEVYVAYTEFKSMLSQEPRVMKLLPLDGATLSDEESLPEPRAGYAFDPTAAEFLEHAVPMYLSVFLRGAIAESIVCEQAARMMSMDSASKNAEEIIEDLTLMYNRERQGIITQELNEIVSGANALK